MVLIISKAINFGYALHASIHHINTYIGNWNWLQYNNILYLACRGGYSIVVVISSLTKYNIMNTGKLVEWVDRLFFTSEEGRVLIPFV